MKTSEIIYQVLNKFALKFTDATEPDKDTYVPKQDLISQESGLIALTVWTMHL